MMLLLVHDNSILAEEYVSNTKASFFYFMFNLSSTIYVMWSGNYVKHIKAFSDWTQTKETHWHDWSGQHCN